MGTAHVCCAMRIKMHSLCQELYNADMKKGQTELVVFILKFIHYTNKSGSSVNRFLEEYSLTFSK